MSDLEKVTQFMKGEYIVSMVNYKNRVLIATTKTIYELKGTTIEPIEIKVTHDHDECESS